MDPDRAFAERTRVLNERHGVCMAMVAGGGVVLSGIADLVSDAHPPLAGRIGILAVCLAAFVGFRFWPKNRDPLPLAVAMALANCALCGTMFARAGALDGAWFAASYFGSFYTVALVSSLGLRAVLTTLVPISFLAGYVGVRPDALGHPALATALGFHALAVAVSVALGHLLYGLQKENTAHARSLEVANHDLEVRVSARTEELRGLAHHIASDREAERRRLAREIHDETGQLLTALRMEVEVARQDVNGHVKIAAALERMDRVLDQALASTRDVVSELRPRVLDDLGLAAATEWFLKRFAARSDVACAWHIDPPDLDVDAERATAAFRILQEAMTNVARHSGARRVEVRLSWEAGRVHLEIADDGRGFTTPQRGGFGLLGMRERAEGLGGTFEVASAPGTGTTLRLVLPDPAEEARA